MAPTTDDDDKAQEHYNFMQERKWIIRGWMIWMLFLCLVLVGLILLLPKF